MNFPKRIFVQRDTAEHGETPILLADNTADGAKDGDAVAIYELVSVHTKRVTHSLEAKRSKARRRTP